MENILQNSAIRRTNLQVSLSCRHCNGFQKLKWRCMTCKFTVCDNCKKIHSQMPSARNHFIVQFPDIAQGNEDLRLVDLVKKMPCEIHSKQTYINFCETCNYLVCSVCLSEPGHSGHKKGQLEKFVTEKVDGNCEDLPREKARNESFDDSGFFDMMTDCPNEEEWGAKVQRQKGDNKDQKEEDPENSYCLPQAAFESIDNVTTNLSTTANFKVIHIVTTNLPTINFMASASKDEAWIGWRDGNIISKINVHKTKIFSPKQIDQIEGFQPLDISVNSNGDILFLCDKGIKIVKTNSQGRKQVCDFFNFSHLEPICIHCSKSGDKNIWIGCTACGPDFKPTQKSTGQVVGINEKGEVCNIYEFTKANKSLFTLPWRIVDSRNGICVIDRLDPFNGRVISLNKSGHLMWIYNDPHPSFSKKAFLPSDLVVTSSGNIIICDSANSSLHILNEEGKLISQPHLFNLKIEQPLSVNINHYSGNLWIGTASDSMSRNKKAKMYELEMSGL